MCPEVSLTVPRYNEIKRGYTHPARGNTYESFFGRILPFNRLVLYVSMSIRCCLNICHIP
jgi:hypothetical protein